MEDNLDFFLSNGRQPQFLLQTEDNLNFFQMENIFII
jgi:hypothetical protein